MPFLRRVLILVLCTFVTVCLASSAQAAHSKFYTVPKSIDSTGSTNVLTQVANFIAGVPNGSTIRFQPNGIYRMNGTLELDGRSNLTINGQNATFTTSPTSDGNRAQMRLVDGGGYTVKNLNIDGSSTVGGTPGAFVDTLQWQHGVDLRGVATALFNNVHVTDVYGDCFYVGAGSGSTWSSDIHITNSRCARNGRQGVAVVAGQRVTVDFTTLSAIALMTFDIEPNGVDGGGIGIDFVDNTLGTGPRQQALGIVGGGTVRDVTFARNTLTGKALTVLIDSSVGARRSNVAIRSNTSDTPLYNNGGSAIVANYVDGLTVTGNYQALSGPNMSLVYAHDSCTNAISGNSYPGGVAELTGNSTPC